MAALDSFSLSPSMLLFPSPASIKAGERCHLISQQCHADTVTDICGDYIPCSDQGYRKAHKEFNSSLFSTGYGWRVINRARGNTLYEEDKNIE